MGGPVLSASLTPAPVLVPTSSGVRTQMEQRHGGGGGLAPASWAQGLLGLLLCPPFTLARCLWGGCFAHQLSHLKGT